VKLLLVQVMDNVTESGFDHEVYLLVHVIEIGKVLG
jgi:hypothetical protein